MESSTAVPSWEQYCKVPAKLADVRAENDDGILVLKGAQNSTRRRILFVSNYGMARAWRLWKRGVYPGHHLWGCLELARKGYEVLLPEPTTGKGLGKRLRNDWLPAVAAVRRLTRNDIVYCSHNVLLWTPLLKALRVARCKIVGLLFAREPLLFGNLYDGVIAHTPEAKEHATARYPRALCAHISWGVDIDFFPAYPYEPRWMLSCGKTFRDLGVVAEAFRNLDAAAMVVHPQPESLGVMPPNVTLVRAGTLGEEIYGPLAHHYYRYAGGTLLTLNFDPKRRHSIGLTNLLESMACGRPVVMTRTGASISEIDVERNGVGFYVDPCDASSLRQAVIRLVSDPSEAQAMGSRGRELCERYYNMDRFASDLDAFFERL